MRNRKGVGEAELGLANEMAINQFIAHHSVIFQPEKKRMWAKFIAINIVNVLPPIEAGASCFNENSTTDSEELRRLTLFPQA